MKEGASTKETYHADHRTWNQSHITVVGNNNILNGNHCVARGHVNTINGDACTVDGNHCIVNGEQCTVIGAHCVVNGDNCIVNGNYCVINGRYCVVTGDSTNRVIFSRVDTSPASTSTNTTTSNVMGRTVIGIDAAHQPAEPPAHRIRRTVQTGGSTFNFFGGGGTPGDWIPREMDEALGSSVARPSPLPASSLDPSDPYGSIKDLECESAPENGDGACTICEENVANVAYQCGHVHCPACARKMSECPQCRVRVRSCIRLYRS
jgi:hypothetical protein